MRALCKKARAVEAERVSEAHAAALEEETRRLRQTAAQSSIVAQLSRAVASHAIQGAKAPIQTYSRALHGSLMT